MSMQTTNSDGAADIRKKKDDDSLENSFLIN